MSFFEDEYLGRNNLTLPSMFYTIADAIPGTTAEDICDAVLAAWDAAPEGADETRIQATYRKFLLPIVTDYAAASGMEPETVCDALVTCAQYNEAVEERRKALKEGKRDRSRT